MVSPPGQPGWTKEWRDAWQKTTKALHCRVDDEFHADVMAYAKRHDMSQAEAVRTLITIGLETLESDK